MTGSTEATLPAESKPTTDVSNWEDPPRRPPGTGELVLSVNGFAGPLDWLLEMVRAHRIDLARLSILAMVEAFTTALEAALAQRDPRAVAPLWRRGDWLVMAANLALLRSRLLLPVDYGEAIAARDEAEVLRRQMVGRMQMTAAADWLEQRPQLNQAVFAHGAAEVHSASHVGSLTDFLCGCLMALRLPEDSAVYQLPRPVLWRVADAVERMQGMLLERAVGGWELGDCLPEVPADAPERDIRCRAALARTLGAGLELAREGVVSLRQEQAFHKLAVSSAVGHAKAEAVFASD